MEEIKGCEQRNLEHFNRLIIHLDMDAYYAQVEMKQHNIDLGKPVAVLQWNSIIALNYVAKKSGVKRGMSCFEALEVRNDMIFVHVATIVIN
jgi:DNA polymerase eta